MKKTNAPIDAPIYDVLAGIKEGEFYTASIHPWAIHNGYQRVCSGIDQFTKAKANVKDRYCVQTIEIPLKQRGKLSKFAGLQVDAIFTSIPKDSNQIEAYIKINNN